MTTTTTKPPTARTPTITAPARPTTPMKLPPSSAKPPAKIGHTPKTFAVKQWDDSTQGEKFLFYGPSGIGKTSLAAMAPNPIFIGIDDGGRKIRNPKTGEPLQYVEGVESFQDIRDALGQDALFAPGTTIVLDTITYGERLAEAHCLLTIKTEKGQTAENMEDYGWGKGYRHLTDTMRLLMTDLDHQVRRGVNVVLLGQQGQATVANLAGTDYLEDGPKLWTDKKGIGPRGDYCEWCDHVIRVGHPDVTVVKANAQATKGKAVGGSSERVLYTAKEIHYVAKSRPLKTGGKLPAAISFSSEADDFFWRLVAGEVVAE